MSAKDMPSSQEGTDQISNQLGFLSKNDWLDQLTDKLNTEAASFYQENLLEAAQGLGYCIDERPIADSDPSKSMPPKPAFVGGAAGWVVMYLMSGQTLENAVISTKALYQKMNWGDMEIHTDNHSHEGQVGCGFLNVQQSVIDVLKQLNIPGLSKEINKINGVAIFQALKNAGAKVITLTGAHKASQAKVVINQVVGKTLDRQKLYDQNPAFLWDAWATANNKVLTEFNQLAQTNLELDNFTRLQAGLHLATGMFLNAVRLDGAEKNVVMLS